GGRAPPDRRGRCGPDDTCLNWIGYPTFVEEAPMNLLDSLKRCTTVVADTGDLEAIAEHKPQDATTNPSLLYQAAQMPEYEHLLEEAIQHALKPPGDRAARAEAFMGKLLLSFRGEAVKLVPGRRCAQVAAC